MSEIAVIREGAGPEVLLVHGGASPRTTWGALTPLSARWTLAFAHRRGYPPSPEPRDGRQDFEVDAGDLVPLFDARPHVVAHSYGVLGALIAATRRAEHVRSLTLIEPPIYHLTPGDPEVEHLGAMGDTLQRQVLQIGSRISSSRRTRRCDSSGHMPDPLGNQPRQRMITNVIPLARVGPGWLLAVSALAILASAGCGSGGMPTGTVRTPTIPGSVRKQAGPLADEMSRLANAYLQVTPASRYELQPPPRPFPESALDVDVDPMTVRIFQFNTRPA